MKIRLLNFDGILKQVTEHIQNLPEKKQKQLKETWENGRALLKTNDELKAYIHYYGNVHRKKLDLAFSALRNFKFNSVISVMDCLEV